jgi:DnaK suppressor protein
MEHGFLLGTADAGGANLGRLRVARQCDGPARGRPRARGRQTVVPRRRHRYKGAEFTGEPRTMGIVGVIEDNYRPSDEEPFMNERQKEYFRRKLIAWRESILAESKETLAALQNESENHPDIADRASSETDRAIELRARDRQRKLIAKIEAALTRIDDGSYGFCVETGDPISLRRLDARPIATLSVEAQERHERRERIYRDE